MPCSLGTQLKEKIFIECFSETFNPEESAKIAGCKASSAAIRASEILARPHVQAELKKRLDLKVQHQKLRPAYVLEGLREVFERCMQIRPVLDKAGKSIGKFMFNPHGAIKALKLIGQNYDMFSPDVVVNLNVELDKELTIARKRASELLTVKQEIVDITEETKQLSDNTIKTSQNSTTIEKQV